MKTQRVTGYSAFAFTLYFQSGVRRPKVSVDTQKSTLTVRVYKSGFFSAFAHDHEIRAPIESGSLTEESPTVEIVITAASLKVLDKESSDSEKQKIQTRMLGPEVLDTAQFKEIRFKSTQVQSVGQGVWQVTGDLTFAWTNPSGCLPGAEGEWALSRALRR